MEMESRVILIMASLTLGISRMMKIPTTPPRTLTLAEMMADKYWLLVLTPAFSNIDQ